MSPEFFGGLSAAIVAASSLPYFYNAWHRKITPNVVSWSLWTGIGLAMLVTYASAGASFASILPVVFGFLNPLALTCILLLRSRKREPLAWYEYLALSLGLLSVAGWLFLQLRGNQEHMGYALLLALAADACAAIATILFVWKKPLEDRPIPWILFTVGQLVMLLSITNWTWTNYLLPVYMAIGCSLIWFPLVRVRISKRTPFKDWI